MTRRSAALQTKPIGGVIKRAIDIVVAVVALVLLSPLFLAIAVLITLESPGPVFFLQRRGGYLGRTFKIYKFRTMSSMDDNDERICQVSRSDCRVTRIGAVLRQTSADELPQFINVLLGDMSLVGPRPHPIALDKDFALVAPEYNHRQRARPGITGLAQVSGSRGPIHTPEEIGERVRLDAEYIGGWSVWLDCAIALRTVAVVFADAKAY